MISVPAIEVGLLMGGAAVSIGLTIRTLKDVPMWSKVLCPAGLGALAVACPMLINTMQGSPKLTTFEALPHCITIEALDPDDASKTAIMILKDEDGHKRAYQILVDDRLHDGLVSAEQALSQGDPAVLCKDKKKHVNTERVSDSGTDGIMVIDSSLGLKHLKGN